MSTPLPRIAADRGPCSGNDAHVTPSNLGPPSRAGLVSARIFASGCAKHNASSRFALTAVRAKWFDSGAYGFRKMASLADGLLRQR